MVRPMRAIQVLLAATALVLIGAVEAAASARQLAAQAGRGRPTLSGEGAALTLAGLALSVADVFDALTSKRPYKEAWPIDAGLASVEAGAGKQFDPDVVAAFRSLAKDGTIDRIRAEVAATAS